MKLQAPLRHRIRLTNKAMAKAGKAYRFRLGTMLAMDNRPGQQWPV